MAMMLPQGIPGDPNREVATEGTEGMLRTGGLPRGGFPLTDGDITSTTSRLAILLCLLPVMMKD